MSIEQLRQSVRGRIDDHSLTRLDSTSSSTKGILIAAVAFVTTTDVLLVTPAFPAMGTAFGISETRASLVVTAYAIPSVFLAPVVGYLADRIGRRPVLVTCLSVFGVAGSLITVVPTFRAVLLLRATQGIAAGSILSSLALTLVGDYFVNEGHDRMMGLTVAAVSVGAAVYPTLGGYLAGISWRAPFAVYLVCLPLAVVAYLVLDGGSTERSTETDYLGTAVRELPFGRMARTYGLLAVGFTVMFGGIYVLLPLYLQAEFELTSVEAGVIGSFVLGTTAVTSIQSGRFRRRLDRGERLTLGFGAFGVGTGTIGASVALPIFGVALVAVGIGLGVMIPTLFAIISDLAPDRLRAGVMSLRTTTVGITQTVGPVVFTLSSGLVGYRSVFVAAGVVLLGTTLLVVRR
jgi:MFS family permease